MLATLNPTPTNIEVAPATESPAAGAQPLAFRRLVVFTSLGGAVAAGAAA